MSASSSVLRTRPRLRWSKPETHTPIATSEQSAQPLPELLVHAQGAVAQPIQHVRRGPRQLHDALILVVLSQSFKGYKCSA